MTANLLLDRLLLALAITTFGLALYWLYNRLLVVKARSNYSELPAYRPGVPAILYFTTPECLPCKTVQKPALKQIAERFGNECLTIIEINAQEQPDLASRWGVLSVPTTFILDRRGDLKHVNHGVTRAEKLLAQVQEAGLQI